MVRVMIDDPVCPTDGVLLWWKAVANWIDPMDGSTRRGVWQCHKCRVRFILCKDELVPVKRAVSLAAALSAPGEAALSQ
jgi:hypothetical protein